MTERFALYYAPSTDHRIWQKAAQWLGRDPAGEKVPAAEIAGIDPGFRARSVESARRYGFHATLKAPMALATGADRPALEAALSRFGQDTAAVSIGRLTIADLDGFLALVPDVQTPALTDLVGRIVEAFEPFRAPLSAASRDKRIRDGRLNARQIAYLDRYGYPYVLDEFRFHMTLTDRLGDTERPAVQAAAVEWFGPLLDETFVLDRIALFHEREPGAPFTRLADFPLSAGAAVDG
jgi:putative phosphonate metabolism protein